MGRYMTYVKPYEDQLARARMAALCMSSLHAFSRFLAILNITWVTVILLGPFFHDLSSTDHQFVPVLVLLQFARLFSFTLCIRSMTAIRAWQLMKPSHELHLLTRSSLKSCFGLLFTFTFTLAHAIAIACTFILPAVRLRAPHSAKTIPKLPIPLLRFYLLVMFHAAVSLVAFCLSFLILIALYQPPEQSIMWYYDAILQLGFSSENGVIENVEHKKFKFFRFAYEMLGRSFQEHEQVLAVGKLNRQLIRYVYAHRNGMDFLRIYMDADDAFVQQAAASLVGLWASDRELPTVEIPAEVLKRLADMVGAGGEVAQATANSFGELAKRDPAVVTETMTSGAVPVVHRMAELVLDARSTADRSLHSLVRALALVFDKICNGELLQPEAIFRTLPEEKVEALARKLKQLLATSQMQQLRVQSAYLLHLLGRLDGSCIPLIRGISPRAADTDWLTSEVSMLGFFYKHVMKADDLLCRPFPLENWLVCCRANDGLITPPPWRHQFL